MRLITLFAALCFPLVLAAETPASALWTELKAKREALPSLHEEFALSQTFKDTGLSQSSKRQIILDMSTIQWREKTISGSGNQIRIFDGKDLFRLEEGDHEFLRIKFESKKGNPAPAPYSAAADADWSAAVELDRRSCGISGIDHVCVELEAPLKNGLVFSSVDRVLDGRTRVTLDIETGMLMSLASAEIIGGQRKPFRRELSYVLTSMGYGAPVDAALFRMPFGDMHEVKKLSPWNAAKIRKELAGKPAPDLVLSDIHGNPVSLSDFKGKTVLLDFWTTWCPPCRADGPALDKLNRNYGARDLMILGISVSEERAIVEKFLKEHPHGFPIVLTTENEMPRPYQIGDFPTYILIDKNGTLTEVTEGDQGFSHLVKLLKNAGLEVE